MRTIPCFLAVFGVCSGQNIEPHSPTDPSDLVQRLAVSDHVVVGTVTSRVVVHGRTVAGKFRQVTSLDQVAAVAKSVENDYGVLITVRVDTPLCRGAAFQPASDGVQASLGREVYLFLREDETGMRFHDPNPFEQLIPEGKYLLMLKPDPDKERNVEHYELDGTRDYYRPVARARGAIQLEVDKFDVAHPPAVTPPDPGRYKTGMERLTVEADLILSSTKALCQAVQPSNVLQRIDALQRVKSAPNLDLRLNADIAIKLLRGEPIK